MEVAKLSALPNLKVRFVSCNESAIKRWLSSELEETVFSLTHELFMPKHHTVTLSHSESNKIYSRLNLNKNLKYCLIMWLYLSVGHSQISYSSLTRLSIGLSCPMIAEPIFFK